MENDLNLNLKTNGFVIIDILNSNEIIYLNELCNKYLKNLGTEFVSSSHILNKIESDIINNELHLILNKKFEKLFPELELLGGTLATKVKGKSNLSAHQDWTIVDESKYNSYNLWIPLVDTNSKNGTLGLIVGSHKWNLQIRGFNIPNPYEKFTKEFLKIGYEPNLKAGQAILYNHKLVHYSRPNRTNKNRNTAIIGIKDKLADLQISFCVDDKNIETYTISESDFYRFDAKKISQVNSKITSETVVNTLINWNEIDKKFNSSLPKGFNYLTKNGKFFFSKLLDKFNLFKKNEILIKQRVFPNNYFLDKSLQIDFEKKGYAILKNVISKENTNQLFAIYEQLTTFKEYFVQDKFQNSGRFRSSEIRNFVMKNISQFSKDFLQTVFDDNTFDENTTGAFQIKPPSKVSELNPHQDAPVIDETKENGLFVWIPLCDIDKNNGAVMVLPGSHIWGNHQRSLNVPWVFEKHTKLLWKYMQPIYINKGDVLIWDTAMIHASLPNLSNNIRVALTTTLLPKNFKMVEYFKDKTTPKGKIEKYQVERSYWESEDIMKRPTCPPNLFLEMEDVAFPATISSKKLLSLIKKYL